jgi:predicted HicB family RNase H-like nuclease
MPWTATNPPKSMQESKIGNKNAQKSTEGKADAFLHIRCLPNDKNKWVQHAQQNNLKLSEWITQTLNKAIK